MVFIVVGAALNVPFLVLYLVYFLNFRGTPIDSLTPEKRKARLELDASQGRVAQLLDAIDALTADDIPSSVVDVKDSAQGRAGNASSDGPGGQRLLGDVAGGVSGTAVIVPVQLPGQIK